LEPNRIRTECQSDSGRSGIYSYRILRPIQQKDDIVPYQGGRVEYILYFPSDGIASDWAKKYTIPLGDQYRVIIVSFWKGSAP